MCAQWCFLVSVVSILSLTTAVEGYTIEELLLLMKANMQKYTTITCELSVISYHRRDENGDPKVQRTQEIVSRWTPVRSFSRTTERYLQTSDREGAISTVTTVVITPEWNKELREAADGRTPRGFIRSGTTYEPAFYGPMVAMWDINGTGFPLDTRHLEMAAATLTKDDATGRFILTCQMGSSARASRWILHIDPNKGFIPVVKEFQSHDGRLLQRYECTPERASDGLWIPTEYSWHDPGMDYSTTYEVRRIQVNAEIPADHLDFAFPSGTVVEDQIVGLRYQVDDSALGEDGLNSRADDAVRQPERSSGRLGMPHFADINEPDLAIRALATERELEDAFAKTRDLGLSQPNERVFPFYSWWACLALIACGFITSMAFLWRRARRPP